MGTIIGRGLISGSIDASLEEIDLRSQDPGFFSKDGTKVGPFAVLNLTHTSYSSEGKAGHAMGGSTRPTYKPAADHGSPEFHFSSYPAVDIPGCADDLLQCSDLFSIGVDFTGILSDPSFGFGSSLDFQSSSQLDDPTTAIGSTFDNDSHLSPYLAQTLSPLNILGDAPFLLKNFQMSIVPQMTVVPLAKSPWNILNVSAALVSLGELTIMESKDVNHARQANLYSLLACSAISLAMTPSAETLGSCPRDHWKGVAEQAYQDARSHMKISLAAESGGAKKAKLKDQLMAIYGLTEYAVCFILIQYELHTNGT
jgi:arginine metabolism regulation protein II